MLIANPIYDSVFKYLLDDSKAARLLLSASIGSEVEELAYKPTETRVRSRFGDKQYTVFHMDFQARIKTASGKTATVLIEIQKAKLPSDIQRFRSYLGRAYSSPENISTAKGAKGGIIKTGVPIIAIYFLGHALEIIDRPAVRFEGRAVDMHSDEVINSEGETFVESLTHKAFFIQIPLLKGKRRDRLELLLSLFDQSNMRDGPHLLDIDEESLPTEFRPVLRRLLKAAAEPRIVEEMDAEDLYLADLEELQRNVEAKDKVIEAKDKAIEAERKAKEEERRAKEEERRAKEDALKEIEKLHFEIAKFKSKKK